MSRLPLLLAGILISMTAFSQQQEEVPEFSDEVSVSIVNLYASVRDGKGRPVYGLKQEDFSLFIDNKPQEISNFSADITEPINIVFLLDVSGSMRMLDKFDTAKSIIRGVCNLLAPDDEVALMIFADGEVEMLVEFTKDKKRLIHRMDQLKAYGGTALVNAVAYCHRLLINNVGKKGVLLLSDGLDNRSQLPLPDALGIASRVEMPIYTFELIQSRFVEEQRDDNEIDVQPLKAFSEATGGLYFTLQEASSEEVAKACAKIFEDLKYQYYIGYMARAGDKSYGRVDLRTRDRKHHVRVRYSVVPGG
jgi:VWFA-related protein